MGKSISFLLGAGFSVPMGFPTGEKLGEMIIKECNEKVQTEYGNNIRILKEMIDFYRSDNGWKFDYEDFFDKIEFYFNHKVFKHYLKNKYNIEEDGVRSFLSYFQYFIFKNIFNKIHIYNSESVYDNFLKSLSYLLKEEYEINIHTLNHDLLFESFKKVPLINNQLCDGYENDNTPYRIGDFNVPYYNYKYDKKIRLYKLHGSIDQYKYFNESGNKNIYVKIDKPNKHDDIYEYSETGERVDTYLPNEREPRFLTGRNIKIRKCKTMQFYANLFSHFKKNLKNSKCLIIIGYSGNDKLINECIENNLHSPCFVYDIELKPELKNVIEKVDTANNFQNKVIQDFELPTTINF